MKLIAVALLALVLTTCDDTPKGATAQRENYTIKTIDGCEYIEFDSGILDQRVYSLTHKGNCKNPVHCAAR